MSSLHDPFDGATPSQKYAAAAHRERMKRFHDASHIPAILIPQAVLPPIPNEEIKRACEITAPPSYSRVGMIQRAVLAFFPRCTLNDLLSNRRPDHIVKPRQIAMYLTKEMTGRSLPDIGRRFGGRDHTTVLHAVRKIERLVMTSPVFAAEVSAIRETIPEGI